MEVDDVGQISLILSESDVVDCDFNVVTQYSDLIRRECEKEGYTAESSNMTITLPNASKRAVENVLKWVKSRKTDQLMLYDGEVIENLDTNNIPAEDIEFLENLDRPSLFEIILVCNYLELRELLESSGKFIAGMIKGKDPQGIRDTFNITNDFLPGEEDQIRKENEWCEEK